MKSKSAARVLLAKQAACVKAIRQEGLLSSQQADELLAEIDTDVRKVEKERRVMHAEQSSQQSKARRRATMNLVK